MEDGGTTSLMSMKFDVAKNLTANGFSSASSKFIGWNANEDGTGMAYKDGQNVKYTRLKSCASLGGKHNR